MRRTYIRCSTSTATNSTKARDRSRGQTKEMFNVAVSLLELHNAAGVDPLLTTKAIADSNGVDINAWRNLVN